MNVKGILAMFFVFVLFFGCINLNVEPKEDEDTGKKDTDKDDGKIVVDVTDKNNSGTGNGSGSNGDGGDTGNGGEDGTGNGGEPTGNAGYTSDPNSLFAAYFFNVSVDDPYESEVHGDGILIKKGEFDMLIDGGPEVNSEILINALKGKVDDIEVLVCTNDDMDHCGAQFKVLDEFAVEEFWYNGKAESDQMIALLNKIDEKGIEKKVVLRGTVEEKNGMDISVLSPESSFASVDAGSIVMKFTFGEFCLMTTSDIGLLQQSSMISIYVSINKGTNELTCNVIQVPYHGVGTGNTQIQLFLDYVDPVYGIISGSYYDHTDSRGSTMMKLQLKNVEVFETYSGEVKVTSDGTDYSVMYVE